MQSSLTIFSGSRVLVLLLILVGSVTTQGQDNLPLERALESLRDDIVFVQELLKPFPNIKAENFLERAIQTAREAASLAQSGREILAWAKIKSARGQLNQAMRLVLGPSVHRTRDRFWEVIRQAESAVPGTGNQKAVQLLRQAQKLGNQAEQANNSGNLRQAVELYRVAIFQTEQALKLAQGPRLSTEDQLEQERQRFLDLLTQAEKTVADAKNKNAERILQQARQQIPSIQNAINKGQYLLAFNLYHNTTRLLLRALDLANGSGQNKELRLEDEIALLEELIESTREKATSDPNKRARSLFHLAEEQFLIARSAAANGNPAKAFRRLELARRLIGRALNLAGGEKKQTEERVQEELDRLQTDIEVLAAELEVGAEAAAEQGFIAAAQDLAQAAERALERNQTRQALALILAGNQLVTAAHREMKSRSEKPNVDANAELDQLARALAEARAKYTDPAEVQLLNQAEILLNRSKEALAANKPVLALELSRIALNLILKTMRNMP